MCSCGNKLSLDTEVSSGVCLNCQRGQEHLRVVSQEGRQVVSHGPDYGERETKEQRWRRTHAEDRRRIHRAGQARRRANP